MLGIIIIRNLYTQRDNRDRCAQKHEDNKKRVICKPGREASRKPNSMTLGRCILASRTVSRYITIA